MNIANIGTAMSDLTAAWRDTDNRLHSSTNTANANTKQSWKHPALDDLGNWLVMGVST